jgi:hypothetical protein
MFLHPVVAEGLVDDRLQSLRTARRGPGPRVSSAGRRRRR